MMKDAYSFDTSLEGLNESYLKMYNAYHRIFRRCGLPFLPVEAESGPIGGDASHEFMILSENGEDRVVHCAKCNYAANTEKAEIGGTGPELPGADVVRKEIAELSTPGAHTIEQVCQFLKVKPKKLVKTLIYVADGVPCAVLVRGDHEVNENKLRRLLQAENLELADEKTIEDVTGAPVGFAGPVGLAKPVKIIADYSVRGLVNMIVGANKNEKHLVNVNLERDFNPDVFADVRNAEAGDPCPHCGELMTVRNTIEVGHVFKLGTKYSTALSAKFLDVSKELKTIIMGCYGIGVSRIVAGIVETSNDNDGIVWPVALAPYEVDICPVSVSDEASMNLAERLHQELTENGVDCILDDRDQRPGVKFKDADLIGFPVRIVIGAKGLASGQVEVKWRWEKEATLVPIETAVAELTKQLEQERKTSERFRKAFAR